MMSKKPVILYFDPYIAPRYLLAHIDTSKYDVFVLLSPAAQALKTTRYHIDSTWFNKTINLSGNLDADTTLVETIALENPIADFIIGGEVNLAYLESLIYAVFPDKANHPTTSELRVDKYSMNEALKGAALNAIKQIRITKNTTQDEISEFLRQVNFPVVVKPAVGGTASVGVELCDSETQVLVAIDKNFNKFCPFDLANTFASQVIQECIFGEEYYVDGLSDSSIHVFSNVYRYKKSLLNGKVIYRYSELVDVHSKEYKQLTDYTRLVLNTLNVTKGFTHTEVILSASGLYLVELNLRMSGTDGFHNQIAAASGCLSQGQLYQQYLTAGKLPAATENANKKYSRVFFLQSFGRPFSSLDIEPVKSLESYFSHKIWISERNSAHTTDSLLDTIALIGLVAETKEKLDEDTQRLFELEQKGTLLKNQVADYA